MKNPALYFLASAVSKLDPVFHPRDAVWGGTRADPAPAHHGQAAHGGNHHAAERSALGIAQYAALLALISGLSLPIGAVLGLRLKPHDETIAQWMAIGAGALLFAVSVELYGHAIHSYHDGYTEEGPMILMLLTSLFGSFFFAWISKQITGDEEDSDDEGDEDLSKGVCPNCKEIVDDSWKVCPFCAVYLTGLTNEDGSGSSDTMPVGLTLPSPMRRTLPSPMGRTLSGPMGRALSGPMGKRVSEGAASAAISSKYSLSSAPGLSPTTPRTKARQKFHKIGRGVGAAIREAALQRRLTAQKRWAHLREAMQTFFIIRYMQKITTHSPQGDSTVGDVYKRSKSRAFWENLKKAWAQTRAHGPDPEELSRIQRRSRAAALQVLAMLIVDGIPEGIVMGFMAADGSLGVTFVVSLLIANFPEGFAGGGLMLEGGFNTFQIICMWTGVIVLVASSAGVACYLLLWLSPGYSGHHTASLTIQMLVSLTEGLAGGAMISGIAACMLPEAYERRDRHGAIILSGGYLCTFGFMLSIGIKIILDN